MVAQKLHFSLTPMEMAYQYFSIISSLNSLGLTPMQIRLLAFMVVRGTITNPAAREDFCSMYSTSKAVINNAICRMKKKGLLVKDASTIKVTPQLALDFSSSVTLQIRLYDKG